MVSILGYHQAELRACRRLSKFFFRYYIYKGCFIYHSKKKKLKKKSRKQKKNVDFAGNGSIFDLIKEVEKNAGQFSPRRRFSEQAEEKGKTKNIFF